jgi:hypothetical protein
MNQSIAKITEIINGVHENLKQHANKQENQRARKPSVLFFCAKRASLTRAIKPAKTGVDADVPETESNAPPAYLDAQNQVFELH